MATLVRIEETSESHGNERILVLGVGNALALWLQLCDS